MWRLITCFMVARKKSIKKKVLEMIKPNMVKAYDERGLLDSMIHLLAEPYINLQGTNRGNCYYVRMEGCIGKCTIKHLLKNNDNDNPYCNDYNKHTAFNCPCILKSKKNN